MGEVSRNEMVTHQNLDSPSDEVETTGDAAVLRDLLKDELDLKEDFRKIKAQDTVRHCQQHTARILDSL